MRTILWLIAIAVWEKDLEAKDGNKEFWITLFVAAFFCAVIMDIFEFIEMVF